MNNGRARNQPVKLASFRVRIARAPRKTFDRMKHGLNEWIEREVGCCRGVGPLMCSQLRHVMLPLEVCTCTGKVGKYFRSETPFKASFAALPESQNHL